MLRRRTRILAAFSMLMSLTFAALWVRSRYVGDILSWRPGEKEQTWHLFHARGDLLASRMDSLTYELQPHAWKHWDQGPADTYSDWESRTEARRWLGFAFHGTIANAPGGAVLVPYWFLIALTALLPLWIGVRFWRQRGHHAAGACPVCGYDLRATPDRCPECGTLVTPSSTIKKERPSTHADSRSSIQS